MSDTNNNERCDGKIVVSNEAVSVIAKTAALEVDGAAALDGYLGKKNKSGVKVLIAENAVAADIHLIVKFGADIQAVSEQVQKNVKNAIETMTGFNVKEVNVFVGGVVFTKKEHFA